MGSSHIKILVEFDAVIDMDLAMLKLVQEKYNNPSYINQDIMNLTLKEVKQALINRQVENPLSICIEDKSLADSIYKELVETKYDEILDNHSPTGIMKVIEIYRTKSDIDVTVLCSNDREASIVKLYNPNINTTVQKHDNINPKDYDVFFLKNIIRVFVFNGKFEGKHIFILKYAYSLFKAPEGDYIPNPAIARVLYPSNRVGTIDVYDRKEGIRIL